MIDHSSLDVSQLSAAAGKALAPGPARMMAARGLAPLAPADQVTVLYQLAIDGDANLAAAAKATAQGLPDNILASALADARLDPRVIDLFAQLAGDRPSVFESLVANGATADDTIATLAGRVGAREIDRIAANEQRLLRHPRIISAMYLNRAARMSTVDRVVELAVRNNVRVPDLAAWDEIAAALQAQKPAASSDADKLFEIAVEATAGDDSALTRGDADQISDDEPEKEQDFLAQTQGVPIEKLSVPMKIRLAQLGNAVARGVLIRDPVKMVALAAIKAPAVTEVEAARYASGHALSEEVIRYIAQNRAWTKRRSVQYALCRNPKTPVPDAMRMMPFLRERDLTMLSKSKGVASAVVAQARKLLSQRRSGDKR